MVGSRRRLAALAVISLLLSMLGFKTLAACPSFFVEDDAWFYLQIGYNWGTLGWSTFDGVNTTSGYHLGWAGILAAVAYVTSLFSSAKSLFLIGAVTVYFFLGLLGADSFGRRRIEKAVFFFFVFYPSLLMESQLLALAMLTVSYFFLTGRKSAWFYVALVLVPLTRIDATVMLVPPAAYYLLHKDFDSLKKYCFFSALGVAVHFLLMLSLFGSLATVSSQIKGHMFAQTGVGQIVQLNVGRYGRYELAVFLAMLLLAGAGVWASRRTSDAAKAFCVIAGPAVFTAVHVLVNPILRVWYFSPAFFVFALVALRCKAKVPRYIFLVFVCLLVVREARNAHFHFADDAATARTEKIGLFLEDVKRIVPEDEPIFQIDASGFTGFFSGRIIVNGDGLMNSHAYLECLKADGLQNYLRENDVRYVITNRPLVREYVVNFHGLVVPVGEAEVVADRGVREQYRAFKLWRVKDSYYATRERNVP